MLIARHIVSSTITSPLEARYWSTTAYRLGSGDEKHAVKYSAVPRRPAGPTPKKPTPDYLRERLTQQLAEGDAVFDFMVQPRASADMSVKRAMVEWKEEEAPLFKVATIHIPQQDIASPELDELGEQLSFTPWHALPEHRPLGVVNRVRRAVYEEGSRLRHRLNGVPHEEPTSAQLRSERRPAESHATARTG